MDKPIDLVIPWVDGSDPLWQAEKEKYTGIPGDNRAIRYRDWDNVQYVFRGIEKFLPFVRTVHFVTWGHIPSWLNTACPRLNIVRHEDYIPEKYLPVFSSHPIELNFHRIEGLAEQFIYANDDTFFLKPMQETDFFQDGKPVDCAIQNVLQFHRADGIDHIVANDLTALNTHFHKRSCMKAKPGLWFSAKYGSGALHNLYLLPFANFTGFKDFHLPYAYLKSTFEQVWEQSEDILNKTCRNRVRNSQDVNQWLMRYWQMAQGGFVPCKPNRGKLCIIGRDDDEIQRMISGQLSPMICLSDDDPALDFEKEKAFINSLLDQILPKKSMFER